MPHSFTGSGFFFTVIFVIIVIILMCDYYNCAKISILCLK
jgi:hypothetical protein